MNELVSVIVATYNSSNFIINTVNHLQNQTYNPIEIIIVDDGSTDNTIDCINEIITTSKNVFIYIQSNSGVASARNFGINKARGKYIAFCDHDDLWNSDKLAKQIDFFSDKEVGLVYSKARYVDKDGMAITHSVPDEILEGYIFEKLICDNFIPCSSVVVRKTCFDDVGLLCENREMHGSDDRNIWTRIARKFKIKCCNEVLVDIVIHNENYSLMEDKMLLAGICCLNDLWSRFPEIKENNINLFNKSYYKLYSGYGRTFFSLNNLASARQCMFNAIEYNNVCILSYFYLVASFFPIQFIMLIRKIKHAAKKFY